MYSKEQIKNEIPPEGSISTSGNKKKDISYNTAVIGSSLQAIAMMMFNRMYGNDYCIRCGTNLPDGWDDDICEQCKIEIGDKR